jgi:hypothetical protein
VLALLNRLGTDTEAQDIAEYAIAIAAIGVGAALFATVIGGNITSIWSSANSIIGIAA